MNNINVKSQGTGKSISKLIAVLSTIGRVALYISLPIMILCMIVIPAVVKDIKTEDNIVKYKNIEIIKIEEKDGEKVTYLGGSKVTNKSDIKMVEEIKDKVEKTSKGNLILYSEIALGFIVGAIFVLIFITKYITKLFNNIANEDTPFIDDNVRYVKKLAFLLIVLVIISSAFNIFVDIIIKSGVSGFSFTNIFTILVVFVAAYIFEYGYELQLAAKENAPSVTE